MILQIDNYMYEIDKKELSLLDHKVNELNNLYFASINLKENSNKIINNDSVEMLIVILSGKVKITIGEYIHVLTRKSVFKEKAQAVFVADFKNVEITSITDSQIVICGAKVKNGNSLDPVLIKSEDIKSYEVGRENFSRRVDKIIEHDFPAQNILAGETFNEPGKWSSFPPHKHDTQINNEESIHDEVYLFKIREPYGFGCQRIYTKDGHINETITVKDNTLTLIPKGYHPVVAAPGTHLYYFWILTGKERILRMNTDSDFKFLMK